MANGKFIAKNLLGTKLEMIIGLDAEWLKYADGDAQSYNILMATPREYDEESGVLIFESDKAQIFYINEDTIQVFWVAGNGFKFVENTTSTMKYRGLSPVKRDIM